MFRMARGKQITVDVIRRDPLMREIAYVIVPGDKDGSFDLGEALIRQGWGNWDRSEITKADIYRAAEQEARQAQRGLWKPEFSNPADSTSQGQ
jgi:endonuclease YncB( thermonuclease family)